MQGREQNIIKHKLIGMYIDGLIATCADNQSNLNKQEIALHRVKANNWSGVVR